MATDVLLRRGLGWALRLLTAAALAVDAWVHADLVQRYALNQSGGLSQGDLFKIEAGVASFAALLILLSARRLVWALVFLVAASALAAVLVNANYDIGAIGPVPDMYEPLWYPKKEATAVAEAVAAGLALVGFVAATWLRVPGRADAPASRSLVDRFASVGR
ncbi:MAG TPA: hypothetical protein VE442_25365 [Jatrophihabitans sp.]|jgi:glucose-6-phosphate-specific signal transduction histidine kinase|nr:hypothetical protein [Jatrophihabitans sp.]